MFPDIGERIRQIRKARCMTQQELAARLHISVNTLSSYEKNKTTPTLSFISSLADEFETTMDDIIRYVK